MLNNIRFVIVTDFSTRRIVDKKAFPNRVGRLHVMVIVDGIELLKPPTHTNSCTILELNDRSGYNKTRLVRNEAIANLTIIMAKTILTPPISNYRVDQTPAPRLP